MAIAAKDYSMAKLVVCAMVALLPSCSVAVEYTHELLLAGAVTAGNNGVLSDNGQWLIGAELPTGIAVFMNGERLPELIDGVKPSFPRGINDRGDWLVEGLWKSDPNWGSVYRMIKNGEVLDHGWSSYFW
ncbi:MAG: hypothetical protein AMXMBFR61_16550 [Fimbriimonadales bacterium]